MVTTEARSKKGRDSNSYSWWREQVRRRDDHRCLVCGNSDQIEAHHIERWADNKSLRFDITNGATLCTSCHHARHKYVGEVFSAEDTLDVYSRLISLYTKAITRGKSKKCRRRRRALVAGLKDRASIYTIIRTAPTESFTPKTILRKNKFKN